MSPAAPRWPRGHDLYKTVAHDKGKPAARRGRKAVSLFGVVQQERLFARDCLVAEGNWKEPGLQKLSTAPTWEDFSSAAFTLSQAAFEVEAGIIHACAPALMIPFSIISFYN